MSPLPEKILLATAGSGHGRAALRATAELASKGGAELHVVHVWQAEAYPIVMPGDHAAREEHKAGEVLSWEVERLERAGATVAGAHTVRGDAIEAIVELAEDLAADLVVMGSRGLGLVGRLALGSVSGGVVSKAACPLLVVPGGERSWPPTRVVAGEDLSETSAAASALAAAIGGVYGLPMTLVNAYPLLEFGHKARISGVFRVNAEVRAASRRLKRLARELEGDLGRRPEVKVSIGNAADAILQEAEGDDRPVLISTGSRRLGTLDRFRVGSVSARILRSASGPVLIHRDRNG